MKRSVLIVFSMILLCGLLMPAAFVNAYYAGYSNTNYQALTTPVVDGTWTNATEWDDAGVPSNSSANFTWRQKWTQVTIITEYFLFELFTDNTNDTGDFFQFCLDCDHASGAAPAADDLRIDYFGHSGVSGVTAYTGNGTGWVPITFTWGTDFFINDTISASPLNSTPHWIIEFWMDRNKWDTSGGGYQPAIRLAAFDASNAAAGVQAWPPTSPNVPDDWGQEIGTTANYPEPLTVAAVIILSSVAVAVSFYCLRKRPKTESYSLGK